jgi:hypothetical protein
MITWILFGHLMTPEQHQTTAGVERVRPGKTEVIASIGNQSKQRSGNQRIPCCRSLGQRRDPQCWMKCRLVVHIDEVCLEAPHLLLSAAGRADVGVLAVRTRIGHLGRWWS